MTYLSNVGIYISYRTIHNRINSNRSTETRKQNVLRVFDFTQTVRFVPHLSGIV